MDPVREPEPVLLTCSAGGHFTELELIAEAHRVGSAERHWVVPRTPQTTNRLGPEETVTWVPQVHSRDFRGARRNLRRALALHRQLRPRRVVTTGAAQAVPHLVAAAMLGTPITYVESVARLDSPSVTGRIAALLPRTQLLTGAEGWGGRWRRGADAFSPFTAVPMEPAPISGALVALGSERYPFPRAIGAVEAVLGHLPITWQVGNTASPDGIERNRWLPPADLAVAMARAPVVITHGGAGSILTALSAGRVPVVLPRLPEYGEHCDHHQLQMCEALAARGLVVLVGPGERLDAEHLTRAAGLTVDRSESLPRLRSA